MGGIKLRLVCRETESAICHLPELQLPLLSNSVLIYSSRNYTVPDPPGLFDGHVWPMYVKHRKIMEDLGVDVGKSFNDKSTLERLL